MKQRNVTTCKLSPLLRFLIWFSAVGVAAGAFVLIFHPHVTHAERIHVEDNGLINQIPYDDGTPSRSPGTPRSVS
jgi:hypothetical protein